MPALAVRLVGVVVSPSRHAIVRVVGSRAKVEVRGIYAERIVAAMEDAEITRRYAGCEFQGDAVSARKLAAEREPSVTLPVIGSCPLPATRRNPHCLSPEMPERPHHL